ncbi:hypothetical protein HanIR_Chr01g0047171 [Helianthus annuus]|nr:hypothetical protein HanIR_Chr01g0047171 [Helianthus annuus]
MLGRLHVYRECYQGSGNNILQSPDSTFVKSLMNGILIKQTVSVTEKRAAGCSDGC